MTQRIRFSSFILACVALVAAASSSPAATISISTNVLNGGSSSQGYLAAGTTSPTAQVNYVGFIDTTSPSFTAVQYDNAGNTVNLSANVIPNAPQRGANQEINVDGYGGGLLGPINGSNVNMYLAGQPSNTNDPGFGAHANWVVTVNVDAIRAADFGGYTGAFYLTGLFGAWGNIGDTSGGSIQGEVLLNGTRIDNMGLTSYTPVKNQAFDLLIPAGSNQELSFLILNGSSYLWDDGIFENVNLATVPEPSSVVALAGIGVLGLAGYMFRRRRA